MFHKFKYILVLTPAFLWVFLPMASWSKETPRGKWWQMPRVAEMLDIKKEEQKRLDDIYVRHRRSLIDLKSALERERFELDVLIEKETLDEGAVMAQFGKLKEARAALSTERFRFLLEVRRILGHLRYQKLKMSFKELRRKRRERTNRQGRQNFRPKSE